MVSRLEKVKAILQSDNSPEDKLNELTNVLFSSKEEVFRSELFEIAKSSLLHNRPTTSFLERMSHEIRTPLHSILGFLDLLRESLIDQAKREYVNEAFKSAEALHSTIDDILFYSKIESGQISIRESDFNLVTLVEEIVDEFLPVIVQNKLEIVTHISAKLYRNFFADYEKVHKIIFNLIENCVQNTEKGPIVIDLSLVEESRISSKVNIEIKCDGIDLDEINISHLFDSITYFGSAQSGLSSSSLSLVISKKLAEILEGELDVIIDDVDGVTFRLTFDFTKSRVYSEPLILPDLYYYKTVVLSYSETQQKLLAEYCKDMNSEPTCFSHEEEMLDFFRNHDGDCNSIVLISDIISFTSPNIGISQACIDFVDKHHVKTIFLRPLGISFPANYPLADAEYLQQPIRVDELSESLRKLISEKNSTKELKKANKDAVSDEIKILICEDNTINHKLLENYLRGTYPNVDFAKNGKEGILKADKNRYDVILMDCEMPIMDGFEATRYIRNSKGFNAGVPIIALTAHVTKEDREKCFASGMIEFISKPFRKETVLKTISKYTNY
ncbi:MAG: response regulator [Candidatus Zophobacter franzmannii]|nr:response regulator [Candidatus Zophobacter franzmannii]